MSSYQVVIFILWIFFAIQTVYGIYKLEKCKFGTEFDKVSWTTSLYLGLALGFLGSTFISFII